MNQTGDTERTRMPWLWWFGLFGLVAVTLGPLLASAWLGLIGALPLVEHWPPSPFTRWHVLAAARHLFLLHPELGSALVRTLGIAVAATSLGLLLAIPLGYAMATAAAATAVATGGTATARALTTTHQACSAAPDSAHWRRVELLVAAGRLLPGFFWALGLALPLLGLGLYDRPLGLVLAYSAPTAILLTWTVRSWLRAVPFHWTESLLSLGRSSWQVWNAWTWDWLRPRLVPACVLVLLGLWNESVVGLLLTRYRPTLAALAIRLSHLVMIEAGAAGPPGLGTGVAQPLAAPAGALSQLGALTILLALPALGVSAVLGRYLVNEWVGPRWGSVQEGGGGIYADMRAARHVR